MQRQIFAYAKTRLTFWRDEANSSQNWGRNGSHKGVEEGKGRGGEGEEGIICLVCARLNDTFCIAAADRQTDN